MLTVACTVQLRDIAPSAPLRWAGSHGVSNSVNWEPLGANGVARLSKSEPFSQMPEVDEGSTECGRRQMKVGGIRHAIGCNSPQQRWTKRRAGRNWAGFKLVCSPLHSHHARARWVTERITSPLGLVRNQKMEITGSDMALQRAAPWQEQRPE